MNSILCTKGAKMFYAVKGLKSFENKQLEKDCKL